MSKVKYCGRRSLEEATVWFRLYFRGFFRRRGWKNGSRRAVIVLVKNRALTTAVRLEYKYSSIDKTYVFSF